MKNHKCAHCGRNMEEEGTEEEIRSKGGKKAKGQAYVCGNSGCESYNKEVGF